MKQVKVAADVAALGILASKYNPSNILTATPVKALRQIELLIERLKTAQAQTGLDFDRPDTVEFLRPADADKILANVIILQVALARYAHNLGLLNEVYLDFKQGC